ncbi:laccase domain-containing protein [Phycicoccus endophyticus]|uniref:Laccase domain-containing protein n=1 Tax=Phycicoccus endophyticus TaxID=1690220 RepID=A0A7G9R541_9MICO|nr:polyphenol oxidase family protein [Phycicoccus endophyticus]NHI20905.1 laccase domain-containing protein [Phycicoccus endophyticus]QNN50716.1 laccase domain-containing protein [Phycicoccus endophyticus]
MFIWEQTRGGARRAFTGRPGGVSRGPWSGLNLGLHVEDDPAAVHDNRRRLRAAVGRPVVWMAQCHGAEVATVDGLPAEAPRCDAVVTASDEVALAVLVADCVPVLLASPEGVVAAVHAGRPGMLAGVVPRALEAMRDLGAGAVDAVVGPSVCGRCYEVPASMRADAARVEPVSATVSWTGTPAIDVAAGVVAQLDRLGVPVTWVAGCTREREDLYSYRASRTTGRFAGVVTRVS